MAFLSAFKNIDASDRTQAREVLRAESHGFDFYFMTVAAVVVATLGLLIGSEVVVLASLFLMPFVTPLLGAALGYVGGDMQLARQSIKTLLLMTLYAILASTIAAIMFSIGEGVGMVNEVLLGRALPSLVYLFIAVVSGFAVTYALVKPHLYERIAGIALSIALLPPLSAVGIGIAWLDPRIALGALVMFLVNALVTVAASLICFSLLGFGDRGE